MPPLIYCLMLPDYFLIYAADVYCRLIYAIIIIFAIDADADAERTPTCYADADALLRFSPYFAADYATTRCRCRIA